MSGLIGKKIGMTSIFDENGKNFHVQLLKLVHVLLPKSELKKDGYNALQLGFDDKAEKHANKAANRSLQKSRYYLLREKLLNFKVLMGI